MNYRVSLRILNLAGLSRSFVSPTSLSQPYVMACYASSSSGQDRLENIRTEKHVSSHDTAEVMKKVSRIKVMSYNILAQKLLERHTELYATYNAKYLHWEYRKVLLYKELRDSCVDIFCLQEVQEDILDDLAKYLDVYGYKYLYKKRTSNNVDGCAIFYLENKLSLCSYANLEYYKPNIQQLDRHNVGIVATFCINGHPQREVVVATTHILFNQKRHDIKLMQIQMMLTEVDRQAFIAEKDYKPIIITGDFNFNETSPVYKFIVEGRLDLKCINNRSLQPMHASDARYHLKGKDMLPPVLGITDKCSYVSEIRKRNNLKPLYLRGSDLIESETERAIRDMFSSMELSHSLNLSNVMEEDTGQVASTFHDGWTCVDFIFYNKDNICPVKNVPKLCLESYKSLPTFEQCQEILDNMPNDICPSDHLPLVATFVLT